MPNITTKEARRLIQIEGGEAWTTSLIVADAFGRPHKNVLQSLDSLIADGTINRLDFKPVTYIDAKGESRRAIRLSKRAALIAMPFIGGKKSRDGQRKLVDGFLTMEQLLRQQEAYRHTAEWLEARASGKVMRLTTTDVIQEFVDYATRQGSQHAAKYYMQITKMEYRALFLISQAVGDGFRDRLNVNQLLNLATAESVAQRALRDGMTGKLHYKAIYQLARERVEQLAGLVGKSLPGERLRLGRAA